MNAKKGEYHYSDFSWNVKNKITIRGILLLIVAKWDDISSYIKEDVPVA
jgi:hypothetical protein